MSEDEQDANTLSPRLTHCHTWSIAPSVPTTQALPQAARVCDQVPIRQHHPHIPQAPQIWYERGILPHHTRKPLCIVYLVSFNECRLNEN